MTAHLFLLHTYAAGTATISAHRSEDERSAALQSFAETCDYDGPDDAESVAEFLDSAPGVSYDLDEADVETADPRVESVRAYDASLTAQEKVPTADDYNAVMSLLGLIPAAPTDVPVTGPLSGSAVVEQVVAAEREADVLRTATHLGMACVADPRWHCVVEALSPRLSGYVGIVNLIADIGRELELRVAAQALTWGEDLDWYQTIDGAADAIVLAGAEGDVPASSAVIDAAITFGRIP